METHKIYVCCGQPQLAAQFLGDQPERSAQHQTNKYGACQRSVIVEGKACTFALWWPDGTESEAVRDHMISTTNGVVMLYSTSSPASMNGLPGKWEHAMRAIMADPIPLVLVGLVEAEGTERQVGEEEVKSFASTVGSCPCFETAGEATDARGVQACLCQLLRELWKAKDSEAAMHSEEYARTAFAAATFGAASTPRRRWFSALRGSATARAKSMPTEFAP